MPASKRPLKHPHITVDYKDTSFTVVADNIVKLADGIAKLNNSGLSQRAIVLLLHDATGVNKKDIIKLLDAAPLLAECYVRPREDDEEELKPGGEFEDEDEDDEDEDEDAPF